MTGTQSNNKWIGKRTIRPDGEDKVTGRAAYSADTTMPGMLWGKVLRSPHPHARIKSINTAKAAALPGVKAVMTAKDIVDFPIDKSVMLGIQDMRWMCRNMMARDKALFAGHPVAAVAATSQASPRQALKLIEVDYEVLPWAIDIEDAMKPGAPILHDHIKFDGKPSNIAGKLEHKLGDIDAGFARRPTWSSSAASRPSRCTRATSSRTPASSASARTARPRSGARARASSWCAPCARYLTGIEQSDIRAIPAEIGGGFGGKTIVYLEPVALVLSKKSGRPVKMVMTREEVFRASGPDLGLEEHGQDRRQEGRHHRRRARARSTCRPAPSRARRSAAPPAARSRPTTSPNVHSLGFDVVSNRSKVAAYRAPGAPIGAYAVECVLDEVAEALKMDPLELRLKNAAKQGTKAAHGPIYPVIGYEQTLKAAMEHPHYKAPLGPNQGRGVASGFWFNAGGEFERPGQHHRGRHGRRDHRPSRHRRLARLDRQHHGRAARHRLQQGAGADRRHQHDRLLEPDRRQPRHLCLGHGGDAVDAAGDQDAARARGQDLEDRCGGGRLGERRGASRRRQRRQVPAAVAGPDRRPGERHRRPDRRRRRS